MSVAGGNQLRNHPNGSRQFAVLPVRLTVDGALEVMLITSRDTRRWVVPKGWPMRKRTAAAAAMTEAYEEAGLEGEIIGKRALGSYRYVKAFPSGERAKLRVDVYLMLVDRQLDDWPERSERETQWFDPMEAASLVAERGLDKIIRTIPAMKRRKKLKTSRPDRTSEV